jgi:hypothetical protein
MYQFIIQTMIDSIQDSTCLYYVLEQEKLTQFILLNLDNVNLVIASKIRYDTYHNSHLC